MVNRPLRKSIFINVIFSFILVIIPIYVLGVVAFNQSEKFMIKQYNKSITAQAELYLKLLENDLVRIKYLQTNLSLNEDLELLKNNFSEDFDYQDSISIKNVLRELSIIKNSSDNIEKIEVYLPRMRRILEAAGSRTTYNQYTYKLDVPQITSYKSGANIFFKNDDYYMIDTPLYSGKNKGETLFFIETKLDKDNITKIIDKFNATKNSQSFLFFNNFNSVITSSQNKELLNYLLNKLTQEHQSITTVNINNRDYLVVQIYSNYLEASYVQFLPRDEALASINYFKIISVIFTFIVIVSVCAYILRNYFIIKKPMDLLLNSFLEIEKENFSYRIDENITGEFSIVYKSFNKMVSHCENLIDVVYKQKILNEKAKLRQLQAQINPHFLYNSFYILKHRIKKKQYENAESFCDMLGKYFAYLSKNDKNYATLEDEVNHAKLYADIQAIRFSPRIQVEFDLVEDAYKYVKVPKLILQPVIENAFKYVFEEIESGGILKVFYKYYENYIDIIVEDNGHTQNSTDINLNNLQNIFNNSNSIKEPSGLLNIHNRLRLFAGEGSGVFFEKSDLGGLKITMRIFLVEAEDND